MGCLCITAIIVIGIFLIARRTGIHRSLLSNHSSSGSSSGGNSRKHRDQFDHLTSTFPQGSFPSIIQRNSFENKNFDAASLSPSMTPSDLRFVPTAKPSISKNSKNLAVFYPGVPIESIVPNPVYVNNPQAFQHLPIPRDLIDMNEGGETAQRLVTSVYVTNKPQAIRGENSTDLYENQE